MLLAMMLSCVPPSEKLFPYLLCYISAHGAEDYKAICQNRLLRLYGRQARTLPPTMIEWISTRKNANMAIDVLTAVSKIVPRELLIHSIAG